MLYQLLLLHYPTSELKLDCWYGSTKVELHILRGLSRDRLDSDADGMSGLGTGDKVVGAGFQVWPDGARYEGDWNGW